jgi:hypothetical protein
VAPPTGERGDVRVPGLGQVGEVRVRGEHQIGLIDRAVEDLEADARRLLAAEDAGEEGVDPQRAVDVADELAVPHHRNIDDDAGQLLFARRLQEDHPARGAGKAGVARPLHRLAARRSVDES